MTFRRGSFFTSVWAVVLLGASALAQQEQYGQRQILDPDTDEWVDRPVDPATPAGDLEQARSLLATGKADDALDLLKDWTEANPDHERYHEGMYLLGEAYFETGDFYKAYESYEVVVQGTAGELFYKALRREMDVARAFLAGQKRIVWRILRLPAYDDGIQILDRVWEQVPGTRIGEEAIKRKADYYFDDGQMDLAQDEYANLVREYPNGRYTRPAMLRAAESANAAFPGVKFDDRALVEAEERYKQVEAAFPEFARRENVDARLEGIRQQRAEKDLEVALWYEKTKQRGAAEYYYKLILKDWPDTVPAAEARSRLRAMGLEAPEPAEKQP